MRNTVSEMSIDSTPSLRPAARPHGWDEWYRFAHDELGQSEAESVEYANRRYVEERNRDAERETKRGAG